MILGASVSLQGSVAGSQPRSAPLLPAHRIRPHQLSLQRLSRPNDSLASTLPISVKTRAQPDRSDASSSFVPSSNELVSIQEASSSETWTKQRSLMDAMELHSLGPDMPQLLQEMGLKYDPVRLSEVLQSKWPQVTSRAIRVSTVIGGFVTSIVTDLALGSLERNSRLRATQLRDLLSDLGPSFVKIGQALSARPDLLPRDYLEILSGLQDRLPAFPNDVAFAMITEDLGRAPQEMFAEISQRPVAAASLGQVYRGRLFSGEEVAIKVQRPNIGESIAVDMLLLRRLMGVVDRNIPQITQPLVPLVDEFAGRLFAELDYVMEGHNCERFSKLYADVPRVRTPSIYWDFSSRRVLTMEWIDGVKLTDQASMDEAGLSVVDFVNVGIECTLRQLLDHGYFHADPHPGNLLATRSGDLVYLDFGMMSEAPQYARYAIIEHVVHLVNRDYEAMCRDYYTLEFMDRSVDTSPIAPALAAFFDDVLDQSVSQLNFKAIVDGLGEVLFRFPFQVPPYYALILRSLTVLEGLALQADPQYKLLARAYPYMASRLLTDPAPELRTSFEELIIKDGSFRWSRLENLVREGSKSQFFDPTQLWLLADWLLSPSASGVRDMVVSELARMVDAWAAGDMRENIAASLGSHKLAQQLVPLQPREEEALERARLLLSTASSRLQPQGEIKLKGTGPWGSLTPGDVQDLVSQLRSAALRVWPRLEQLMRQPGASDLVTNLNGHLARRFAARSIKFLFGAQQQLQQQRGAFLMGATQASGTGAAPPRQ